MENNLSHNTLFGPSELIATLPGILGFYPQESIVIIGLSRSENNYNQLTLGPVMRMDLGQVNSLNDYLFETNISAVFGSDVAFAVALIISRIPNSELVREAIAQIRQLPEENGVEIMACWHVSEIAQGTPYTLIYAADRISEEDKQLGSLRTGTVSSVIKSPSMRPFLEQGILPELEREDALAYFQYQPVETEQRGGALTSQAMRKGKKLLRGLESPIHDTDLAAATVDEITDIIVEVSEQSSQPLLGQDPEAAEANQQFGDALLINVAALLSQSMLRDCLIRVVLDNAEEAASILLYIARHFNGTIRANALSLWAIAAVQCDFSAWANFALQAAQEEVADHSLSGILLQLMYVGGHDSILEAAQTGSDLVWDAIAEAS